MVDPIALVVGPLVNTVLGKVTSLATQKYQLLQGVQEDVKKLISHLTAIQSVIEDAEKKQLDDTQTRYWLGKLQEVVYDAEDVLETFATEELVRQKKQQMDNDINSLSIDLLQSRLLEFLAGKPFLLVLDDVWVSDYNEIEQLLKLLKKGGRGFSIHHCYQVRDNEVREISDRLRHVSFLCNDVETPALKVIDKCKRLRTFLSPSVHRKSFGKALDELFRSLKYIRMLDLSSSTLMELPPSVQKLKLLHYLDLSNTEIRELPNSICSLYNLQTLKLLGCLWLFQLPQDLSELVNLQHLELDDIFWFKASTLPPRMGSLTSLQNLHAFHVSQTSGYKIDELKNMNCINGKLLISKLENAVNAADAQLKDKEKLRNLVFEWSSSNGGQQDEAADETVLEELQPHLDVKELQLIRYKGTRFPSWIRDGLLQNLVSLSFNHCSKCKVLSLGQLGHLVKLDIKGMLELEEWPEARYPSLHRMKISNCPKLRNVPRIFPAMTVLKIKKCESLQILPVTPFLNFLILVDNLVLEDWKETILAIASVNDQGQTVSEQLMSSFLHLIELKLINCPRLRALPEHFAPQKLEISGCPMLSTLPIPQFSRRLQHLSLDACQGGTLVRAIPETDTAYSLVISNISGVTHLPKLPHLTGLKALYIRSCCDLVSLSEEEESSLHGLPSLKFLSIQDCPQLETLPEQGLPANIECLSIGSCQSLKSLGSNNMMKNLTSLTDLYLHDCPALQSLPEEGLPSSLQHLRIESCPLLTKLKIMNIPDLVLEEHIENSPKTQLSSSPWYRRLICLQNVNNNIVEA
ncbi:hypothetical protein Acr_15g0013000 [Actinidia rufa]|uniref:NB-ARC domain-containing disease resistance protein n=1 Tax=Actinidia rufa TaxID=165716 RepID=A0A7J0FVI0_9ERIC|nr:hypothetical protein Acr_15g0013000 [Actinidia rufa]